MSADFPHDVDSHSDRASHEDALEGSASPTESIPTPPPDDVRAEGDDASASGLPDPGPVVALDALLAVSAPMAAEVLTTGPDGDLERLGSIVSPSSDTEILEVLASLQFEGDRVVVRAPLDAPFDDGASASASDEASEHAEAPETHLASDASGTDWGAAISAGPGGSALGVIVSQPSTSTSTAAEASKPPEGTVAGAESTATSTPRGGRTLPGSDALPELGATADADAQDAEGDADDEVDDDEALAEHLRASFARRQAPVPTTLIALDRLDEDTTFRVREEGDISRLATDLARVGQLFPIEVRQREGERFQVICGFRRLAALRFLHREFVIARVHADLRDEDAQLMALAAAIHAEPVELEQLEALREQLEAEDRLPPAVRDMLDKALAEDDELAPELAEEEIDADELASDVSQRLGAINQELSMLADVFASLEPSRQAELLMQLRYSSELVTYLEGQAS